MDRGIDFLIFSLWSRSSTCLRDNCLAEFVTYGRSSGHKAGGGDNPCWRRLWSWNDTAEPVSNWIGLLFQVITPSPN